MGKFAEYTEQKPRDPNMNPQEKRSQLNKYDDWVADTLDDLIVYLVINDENVEAKILAQAKEQYLQIRKKNYRKWCWLQLKKYHIRGDGLTIKSRTKSCAKH